MESLSIWFSFLTHNKPKITVKIQARKTLIYKRSKRKLINLKPKKKNWEKNHTAHTLGARQKNNCLLRYVCTHRRVCAQYLLFVSLCGRKDDPIPQMVLYKLTVSIKPICNHDLPEHKRGIESCKVLQSHKSSNSNTPDTYTPKHTHTMNHPNGRTLKDTENNNNTQKMMEKGEMKR